MNTVNLPTPTWRYEMHLHTSESSLCGRSPGADYAHRFKALGYAGFVVTDHFLPASVVPDLPWTERVAYFCRGYDAAAAAGRALGLEVFFGWEYGRGSTHLLTYGLGRDWLLAHPDLLTWPLTDYCDRVRADGGCIVHAHPFRDGVTVVELIPSKIDAVEVLNACRTDDANRHARDFAASFGLPQTAGSDIHRVAQKRLCGITLPCRLNRINDYRDHLVAGTATPFDLAPLPEEPRP